MCDNEIMPLIWKEHLQINNKDKQINFKKQKEKP